jgi:hypothetical protein
MQKEGYVAESIIEKKREKHLRINKIAGKARGAGLRETSDDGVHFRF